MAKEVKIDDRVSAMFGDEPYMGTVTEVKGKKAVVEFDDDTIETVHISKLTVHPKKETKTKNLTAKMPLKPLSVAEIEAKADEIRRKKVDAANKAKTAKDAKEQEALSDVPLTQDEKDFVDRIAAKLNGRKYFENGLERHSVRMDCLPTSQDMVKYAKLVKRKDVK